MTRTFEIVRIFALKDLRIALTYRMSFALGLLSAFFSMLTFFFITRVVGHGASVGTPSHYFRFVVVGVATANILRAAVMAASANARSDQVEGTLEILGTQPISPIALALGWSALPVIEATLEGALMLALAVPLGFAGFTPDWISVLLVLTISSAVFLSIGFIGAAFVLAIQQGAGITGLALTVMALAGGTLFPTSVLPGSMHLLTLLSPLTYTLRAMRGAMLAGRSPAHLLSGDLGIVLIYAVISIAVASAALSASFRFARAKGRLSRF
jgi:ABC-2 type transport system permease protein